jgi:hypothetical protein
LVAISLIAVVLLAPTASAQQTVSCDGFINIWGNLSQWGAQMYFGVATPEEQATLDTDGDGFACDGAETGVDMLGSWYGEDGYWGPDGYYYYY